MALRHRKPTSPGRRFQTVSDFAELTTTTPEKSLLEPKAKTGGRNYYGRKTSRHRGGGHKQQYRIIDFKRNKDHIPAKVATIEYDPNRTCRIALLHYADGEKRYILAPNGVKVGDYVESGPKADIRPGNSLPMRFIPTGSTVHNVEIRPGGGGKMARSAGMSVQLVAKDGGFATLAPSLDRDAPRADRLSRHARHRRQLRARAHQDRQGRPQPLEGHSPPDSRCRHEPRRPPARWWRRQDLRWTPPGLAVGSARRSHASAKAVGRAHYSSSPWTRRAEVGRQCHAA